MTGKNRSMLIFNCPLSVFHATRFHTTTWRLFPSKWHSRNKSAHLLAFLDLRGLLWLVIRSKVIFPPDEELICRPCSCRTVAPPGHSEGNLVSAHLQLYEGWSKSTAPSKTLLFSYSFDNHQIMPFDYDCSNLCLPLFITIPWFIHD